VLGLVLIIDTTLAIMISLVIGASTKPDRYSNKAIERLLHYNYQVQAISNKSGQAYGINFLLGTPALIDIHTVTLYLNPQRQVEYYDYIIALKPKRVIFNPGTEHVAFEELLTQNGIEAIEACTLVLLATGQY
jgi:uncharacterized protein